MATLRLLRPEEQANRLAEMDIYLDDQLLCTLSSGETKQLNIPAGRHKLKAKIDTQGSETHRFDIAQEEAQSFAFLSNKEANNSFPSLTGIAVIDLVLGALLLLYYFTPGYNTYIIIKKVKYRQPISNQPPKAVFN